MPEKSWTIGSDPSCDLVVQNNTVSGRHCRLTSDGTELTLTDLDSTNGTYVNGERLLGSRSVKTTDAITLGQSQPMPWPGSVRPADSKPITEPTATKSKDPSATIVSIGRGPGNTVILRDSNVSTNHARLIIDRGEFILEDLGSTNGTSIGKVENKISRGAVQPTDTIFFGSTPYRVSDLIDQSQPNHVAPKIRSKAVATPKSPMPGRLVMGAAGGVGVLLLIWVGWFVTREPNSLQTVPADQANTPASLPNTPGPEVTMDPATKTPPDRPKNLAAIDPVEVAKLPAEEFSRALFLIVCTDAQRETPFRVGTGFAVDSETIVTSASVIQAMRSLQQNGYPEAFLFCPISNRELKIDSIVVHPQFEIADIAARKAQQRHDAIYDQLESQPPKPKAFEAVKDRLIAVRMEAFEAMDQKATHDVAVISTTEPLEYWLPGASVDTKLRPKQKINVTGYAFDMEDPFFDRNVPFELSTISSRVGHLVTGPNSSNVRMIANSSPEQNEYAYLGSPVLNAQGQVVGVYSRPTPTVVESEGEPKPTFDASLFKRVRECQQL